ncbi:MBL fold metallo-hydrolase [Peribacillus frigoritolerans]|uniref:AVAST type 1 anti-phage system MBL fold metallo-hydrolase Avs1a n=1 Tax=Peribacillus frigoritolerans TaxID=450367 RepID=UPI002E248C56|nr:MBL fold metallo-hydrolase [Peribacillus frigoritolerans]
MFKEIKIKTRSIKLNYGKVKKKEKSCRFLSNIRVEMFPALEGDCMLISLGNEQKRTHILIDGGFAVTYENYIKPRLKEIACKGEHISLVVVTHIDTDHIEGILKLFKENKTADNPQIITIEEIWHNSYRHLQLEDDSINNLGWKEKGILTNIIAKGSMESKHSLSGDKDISSEHGSSLAALLYRGNYKWNTHFNGMAVSCDNKKLINLDSDIVFRLLSPNNKKLDKLREYWLRELQKEKYDFKLNKDELFDDAYEFYLMNQKEIEKDYENKDISYTEDIKDLKDFLSKSDSYDSSPANGSSISFILEYKGKKLLFLGDSHPQLIKLEIESLLKKGESKLFFDLIKVSHHGSHRNTSENLLKLIDSDIYLISTNGGRNKHPNKETIAKIVCRDTIKKRQLIFNYFQEEQPWDDENNKEKYNYDVIYPNDKKNIVIDFKGGN